MNTSTALRDLDLEDRFTDRHDVVLLNGNQALVKLLLLQRQRDAAAGLNSAGFVTGYRGSPLGGLDHTLWKASAQLAKAGIVFEPGVNEDLAATAAWGTQQLKTLGKAKVDGVFAMWYGKGPGVDRAGDPFKHANFTGTAPQGGVLAVFGDDHPGKSSTVASHSEKAMAANLLPVLYPSNVADIVQFGLLGFAMSRYSGCWVSLKVVNETVEQTSTVATSMADPLVLPPAADLEPPEGVHFRGAFGPARDEEILLNYRLPRVLRFARANRIDRVTVGAATGPAALGIVSAGKAYQDVRQALSHLGIDDQRAGELGLSVYKVGLIWPLEPEGLQHFAEGKQELLFIEEKSAFVEPQAAAILYNQAVRPRITGKAAPDGTRLIPSDKQLDPLQLARVIATRLQAAGVQDSALDERVKALGGRGGALVVPLTAQESRVPYFCSGCPHNTSTNVPEGSVALSGIGCHSMAMRHKPRTLLTTHMGGEGMNWAGMWRFTEREHVFQNLGDGTYFHSGLMAIRGAIASGGNITYKILYNDAVALTGGQPIDGQLSVAAIARQVLAEGVSAVVVVSDNPGFHRRTKELPAGVAVHHRDELDAVQKEMRAIKGCSVLIYEQTCAAEKRRRRSRGQLEDPPKRLFINEAVCEGCGDCSVQSGCISIEPLETEFGRKRTINQSSCNKDYSCVKGFCPSFVSVIGGRLRRASLPNIDERALASIPRPPTAAIAGSSHAIMVAGIGGTGVVTVTAVLAMAAHLESRHASVYDMTGLSQKNGAVFSHLRIADRADAIASQRIGHEEAELVLAFDMLAALSDESVRTVDPRRTHWVGNDRIQPTAAFPTNPLGSPDFSLTRRKIEAKLPPAQIFHVDATALATELCGHAIASNTFLLGAAAQRGWLPVGIEALVRAIELNGVQTELNLRAFMLGRLWVHDPQSILDALPARAAPSQGEPATLDELVQRRERLLTGFQDARYASRYRALVERVRSAEAAIHDQQTLSFAVARGFAKLMAYKDEYEVARLYGRQEFIDALQSQFEGPLRLRANLAPPLLARRDPVTGALKKSEWGGWIFPAMRLLARMKFLRGSAFDPFGYTRERRDERALIDDYESTLLELLPRLSAHNMDTAVALANLPESIRGFGHVKEKSMAAARQQRSRLLDEFATGAAPDAAQRLRA